MADKRPRPPLALSSATGELLCPWRWRHHADRFCPVCGRGTPTLEEKLERVRAHVEHCKEMVRSAQEELRVYEEELAEVLAAIAERL